MITNFGKHQIDYEDGRSDLICFIVVGHWELMEISNFFNE